MAVALTEPLVLFENNDETLRSVLFQFDGGPALDLTGSTVEFILKDSADASDASGTTLSTTSGAITVTGVGSVEVAIPRAALAAPGPMWARMDVIDGTNKRKTAWYGEAEIVNL